MVTVEDSLSLLQWLMKYFNDNTRNSKEQYFNKKLCSTSAVTENVIGMLKVHWRLIYKKFECKLRNMKYVIIATVLSEPVAQRCSVKIMFLEISQILQENICARVSF